MGIYLNVAIAIGVTVGIAVLLALALAFANKYLLVAADPRIAGVASRLPGYNCGACGYAGCNGLAEALVSKTTTKISCLPASPEKKADIQKYLASPGPDGTSITVEI